MIKQTQLLSLRYRSNISDPSYLEILTVFYLFGAIFCIAAALYFAVALSSIKILISGLVICISILVTMTFITRYELLGIEQEPTTTIWENAICILSIPLRIISRLAGLAFAFSNILLVAGLSYFIYLIVSGLGSLDFSQIFTGLSMVVGGLTSAVYLSSPLLIYLIALSLYLLVRLLAQLSGIPGTHIDGKSDLGSKEVHLHFMSKGEDQTVVMSGVDARNLYLSGTLDPGTLVWMDGMQEWQPASEIGF